MAEAGSRYFCHQCNAEIIPKLPDFICERCGGGFIEEVAEHRENINGTGLSHPRNPAAEFEATWRNLLTGVLPPNHPIGRTSQPTQVASTGSDDGGSDDEVDGVTVQPGMRERPSLRSGAQPFTFTHIHRAGQGSRPSSIDLILQHLLTGIGTSPIVIGGSPHLHANPGDYVWGPGGLDSIISQLLNQLEGSGPPPADQSKIDSLPTVKISQSQTDAELQCSVCFEQFTLNENVKKLPCNHHFHEECIFPWLKLHGTCPVCRIDLNGVDTSTQEPFPNTLQQQQSSQPSVSGVMQTPPPNSLEEYD